MLRPLVLTSALLALLAPSASAGTRELLPNLDQEVPHGLEIGVARDGAVRYQLGFASSVYNVGKGPLRIDGRRQSTEQVEMTATQLVERSDGSVASYQGAGTLRYVDSITHRHWHLQKFDTYELRRASDYRLVGPDAKTGFCLGDRFKVFDNRRLPAEPPEAVFTGGCGYDRPELLEVSEGISVGYGDDYAAQLEGQYIDITRIPAGRYQLVHRVNAARTVRETEYGDNAASVLLQIDWPRGYTEAPVVRQIAGCPDDERCVDPRVAPALTKRTAITYARRALVREYGSGARAAVGSCSLPARRRARCGMRWARGGARYSAKVTVSTVVVRSRPYWEYVVQATRSAAPCRRSPCAQTLAPRRGRRAIATPATVAVPTGPATSVDAPNLRRAAAGPVPVRRGPLLAYCPLVGRRIPVR